MLKRQRKINFAGSTSCISLLLLAFLLVNPLVSLSVSALGDSEDEASAASETDGEETVNYDDQTMPTAHTSDISISFSPTSGSASLTPTNSAGQSAQINVLATVGVKNSGGYSVYVKGSSQNLVGQKSSSNVIPGVSGSSTYANLPVNTWGYYAGTGTAIPENATYKAVTTSGNGDKVAENTNTRIDSDTKTIALSFAAKVNDQKPADTYKNTITLSVVSSPVEITNDFGIATMQEMTSAVCESAADLDNDGEISAQLEDVRDGKYYWVNRLADGKCWMTQDLKLDLATTWPDASLSDYNMATTAYKPVATASSAISSTISNSNTSTRSWNLGEYVITNPLGSSDCGAKKNTFSNCTGQLTAIGNRAPSKDPDFYAKNNSTFSATEYDAHYLVGNQYQWNTATAGTGASVSSMEANGSICPKGWKLPTSGTNTLGSFSYLVNAGSVGTQTSSLTKAPYYFIRGGSVRQDVNYLLSNVGSYGAYWSSSPSGANNAYYLYFGATSDIDLSANFVRSGGFAVRCIAR